jgi:hypothetical protein
MNFLKAASDYAEKMGDYNFFCEYYTRYREFHSVKISAERALLSLYGWDCPLLTTQTEV